MNVDNFDGDGFADQPSIIYAFDGGDKICKRATPSCFNRTTTATQPLGNTLSHSTPQIKLTAKENRLSKRSGRLNTSCFFLDRNKRLPSESSCSVSRPCVQVRRGTPTTEKNVTKHRSHSKNRRQ